MLYEVLLPEHLLSEAGGWTFIEGAVLTVSVAALEKAAGEHEPVTMQLYALPFNPVTSEILSVEAVTLE